jgi:hypothetical protein
MKHYKFNQLYIISYNETYHEHREHKYALLFFAKLTQLVIHYFFSFKQNINVL